MRQQNAIASIWVVLGWGLAGCGGIAGELPGEPGSDSAQEYPELRKSCGNGRCSGSESCQNCPSDCGTCSGCTPATCTSQGKNCGSISDGCGGTLNCGSCPTGQACSANVCVATCTPTTCAAQGKNCGSLADGCGGTLNCGGCPTGQACSANVCVATCTPTTCAAQGKNCGSLSDGCGGTLNCGSCIATHTCSFNVCVPLPQVGPLRHSILPVGAQSQLDHLALIDKSNIGSAAERVMLQSLQGLLAQTKPRIWIQGGDIAGVFLADLKARHGVTTNTVSSSWALLTQYKSEVTGYILYDFAASAESEHVALSLAGPMRAVVIDASIEAQAKNAGLTKVYDVMASAPATGKEVWAFDTFTAGNPRYFSPIAIEQTSSKRSFLFDLGVSRKAFTFYDQANTSFRTRVAQTIGPHALFFGWGPDEFSWVDTLARGNASGVASDYCTNLSALQWVREPVLRQRHRSPQVQDGVHYLAFVMSDGDNVQWLNRGFMETKWWGSPLRGTFPMSWEMAPILGSVAPSLLRYYQNNATPNDFYVGGPSGYGYTLPSRFPDVTTYAQDTAQYAAATDLRIPTLIDQPTTSGSHDMSGCDSFLAQPEIMGVLYKKYTDYNDGPGTVRWQGGKPCIAYRYLLWENGSVADSPSGVAAAVKAMPRTPRTSQDSYSLVNVHAWSYSGIGGPMNAIKQVIDQLPPEVQVVTAEEIFVLMRQQFGTPVDPALLVSGP